MYTEVMLEVMPKVMSAETALIKLWLELAPRSLIPLATLKSKVLPIQIAQGTAGFQKCCL